MATSSSAKRPPISITRMEQIAKEACDQALVLAETYIHTQTESWNSAIINKMLESLVSASSELATKYKYAINSTIVQHLSDQGSDSWQTATPPAESSTQTTSEANGDGAEAQAAPGASASVGVSASKARRGMHSATGAYWNNETDGMWSYKYEAGETKGMDVVISVIWVAV